MDEKSIRVRTCLYCNKPLHGKRSNAKFCNTTCRSKYWHSNNKNSVEDKPKNSPPPLRGNRSSATLPVSLGNQNMRNYQVGKSFSPTKNNVELDKLYKRLELQQTQMKNLTRNYKADLIEFATDAGIKISRNSGGDIWDEMFSGIVGALGGVALSSLIPNDDDKKKKDILKLEEEIAITKQMIQHYRKNPEINPNKQNPISLTSLAAQSLKQSQLKPTFGQITLDSKFNEKKDKSTTKTNSPNEKIISGQELSEREFDCIEFNGRWLSLIGKPELNFFLLIHGIPGSGKSTFAIIFANYLASHFGTVLYISGEEGFSKTFADKFKRMGAVSKYLQVADLRSYEEIAAELKKNSYNFVFIDSVNTLKMGPEEINELRQLLSQSAFITIAQSTKSGQMRGSNEIIHDCDIEIQVADGKATTRKNRFLPTGKIFDVF